MITDLSSRILSILSLITALGTAAYVYTLDQVTESRHELSGKFDEQLAVQAKKYDDARAKIEATYEAALQRQDERMEGWNEELKGAIAAFRDDSKQLLVQLQTEEQAASLARQTAFNQALVDLPAAGASDVTTALNPPANGGSPTDETGDDAEVSGKPTADPVADQPPTIADNNLAVANLRIAQTLLRPGTGNTTLVVIKNDSQQDAQIKRIRFRPLAEFRNSDGLQLAADVAPTRVVTIPFASVDNTSKRDGFHGIYDRQLVTPIRVPAGESLTLRMTIEDADHEGWGFTGKLMLDYNAPESLVVEAARVAFVPAVSL